MAVDSKLYKDVPTSGGNPTSKHPILTPCPASPRLALLPATKDISAVLAKLMRIMQFKESRSTGMFEALFGPSCEIPRLLGMRIHGNGLDYIIQLVLFRLLL